MSGILNVVTADAVKLWMAIQSGNIDRGRTIWRRILPIKLVYTRKLLGPTSDLAIYRGILRLRGHVAGYYKAPFLDLTQEQIERIRALLEPAGLVPGG